MNQRGDMLVEVTMALAVLAAVLLTALNVANKAFGVSNSAKERSVASGLLQEQAERLRNYRDSRVWGGATGTYAIIQGVGFSPTKFHMDPATPGANCLTSGIYNVCVIATDKSIPAPAKNKILFDITVTWSGVGGGQNKSMLSTVLVDLDGLAPVLPPTVTPGPGPGPSVTLAVSQTNVAPNTSITLTWTTANVTVCSATAGPWSGVKNASGASETRPVSDTATPGTVTYTISCNNGGAPVTDSKTVTVALVSPPPPPPPPPPVGTRLEAENMTPGSTCVPYKVTNAAAGPTATNNAGRLDCYLNSASISNFNIGPSWSKLIVRARIGSSSSCGGFPILSITIGVPAAAYTVSVTSSTMSDNVYPPFPLGSFPGGVANITIAASNVGSSDFYHGANDNCEVVIDYLEFQP